jgi:hypothetical protein
MRKLEDAAFRWDHTNYIESMYVGGFEAYLTPYDFKQQIERSFRIHLTSAEVCCLQKAGVVGCTCKLCVTVSFLWYRSARCCSNSPHTPASTAWTATCS